MQLLGAGAVGEVYLVENLQTRRLEAMKVLKQVANQQAAAIAEGRFHREVAVTTRLHHPNIVPTFAHGRLPNGQLYLTMEYIEGPSLNQLLHQRGPLPIVVVLGILAECADAIFHAHQQQVVHRDIKPHNIILADHPHGKLIKILDFGMAKILDEKAQEGMVLSADGAVFGTPQYMSPEQCSGKPPDWRTDIYALGCVAFELLVGEPPFKGVLAQLFVAHVKKPAPLASQVDPEAKIPPELDALIAKCLAKPVEQRFQSGAELCGAVQGVPGYRPLRRPPLMG